jgi:hypothetical protein
MFCALQDCAVVMERTKHNSSPQVLKDAFDKEICGYLNEQVRIKLNCVRYWMGSWIISEFDTPSVVVLGTSAIVP